MLIPTAALDPVNQARCRLNGWIALDPKNGSTLRKSPEVFKPGRLVKYYLSIPNLMSRVIWAKDDCEAIDNANLGKSSQSTSTGLLDDRDG